MERQTARPLSLAEAKARLRRAGRSNTISLILAHPKESVLAALVLGLVLGGTPGARGKIVTLLLKLLSF